MMKYGLIFTLSFIVSFIVTPLVIRMSRRLGVIDNPVDNRWHKEPTPRMGGIAIFVGFVIASAIGMPFQREALIVLLGSVGIFTLGLIDDKYGTFPKTKFIAQIVIALVVMFLGLRLRMFSGVVAVPLTLLWIVGMTNAFNLIDNMDGLSSGIAFIASMGLFLFSWQRGQTAVPIFSLALAGACLGFLPYNFNPAKIFMGDCGSLFLGYTLSTLAMLTFWQETSPTLPTLTAPVLILGYAIFDTTLVTILRLKAGGYPWVGGKDHSSHRLVRLGLSEKQAVLLLYGLGIVGSVVALIVQKTHLTGGVLLIAILCLGAVAFGWMLTKKDNKTQKDNKKQAVACSYASRELISERPSSTSR